MEVADKDLKNYYKHAQGLKKNMNIIRRGMEAIKNQIEFQNLKYNI